ncbi:dihydrodipicolinate synthase family protein [Microlunatus flavus]|uniref:4-hydroxy-tetrahydrodipicolinate synthase n=1 Tax=Microlunatus flavus TaxID=1036181 RepID=A0A1H9L703_9ACTN|nr:dihydrodipicolinate synthase family protein [Microlunatus flavus]SER07214.1 4-hydroxy-tetrahydrodipicolinate synthase [Microlunatus flavus]
MSPEHVLALLDVSPNLVAIKCALPSIDKLRVLAELTRGRVALIGGLGEVPVVEQWSAGVRGFTSGVANVMPELPLALFDALRLDDARQAAAIVDRLRSFEELRARDAGAASVATIKETLRRQGRLRSAAVRPPLRG